MPSHFDVFQIMIDSLYCLTSMYLSRLDFALYQQVESLVSIPIVLVSTLLPLCDSSLLKG